MSNFNTKIKELIITNELLLNMLSERFKEQIPEDALITYSQFFPPNRIKLYVHSETFDIIPEGTEPERTTL